MSFYPGDKVLVMSKDESGETIIMGWGVVQYVAMRTTSTGGMLMLGRGRRGGGFKLPWESDSAG